MLSGISVPGTLQGKWWNFAFTDLRQVPDASEKELMEIAEEKAAHFLSYDSVRPMVNLVFFPTCQVRVVRFYVSCLLLSSPPPLLLLVLLVLLLNRDPRRTVFSVGPQPRPSTPSVPCRTSTTTIHAQCSLPDLNREYPRPVFPAGPQPRPSTPSVPCRTSTASIHAKRYAT